MQFKENYFFCYRVKKIYKVNKFSCFLFFVFPSKKPNNQYYYNKKNRYQTVQDLYLELCSWCCMVYTEMENNQRMIQTNWKKDGNMILSSSSDVRSCMIEKTSLSSNFGLKFQSYVS
jgi:hypothetical protein